MAQTIRAAVTRREAEMLALVRQLADINSHTPNTAGVNAVADVIADRCVELGLSVTRLPGDGTGDVLVARTRAVADDRPYALLCGHMDTVFPPEGGFTACTEDAENLYGPGVIDMKGGLVAGMYALAALDEAGALDAIPAVFIFNPDEETGSPHSGPIIREMAENAAMALVFECSGLGGETVTGRKGKASYRLDVTGSAGHAGNLTGPKPSAILALARAVEALEALNDPQAGISVNVGLVGGGSGPNTIAREAMAMIDTRYVARDQAAPLARDVEKAAVGPYLPGVDAKLAPTTSRPAWEQSPANKALLAVAEEAGKELGIPVMEQFRGGVSDANLIGGMGVPCLDGMGPAGEHDHSSREYMVKSSLPRRAMLSALTLERAWKILGRAATAPDN